MDIADIPEHLRDTPHPDLDGHTPRQALNHIRDYNCRPCRITLEDMTK